MSGEQGRGSGPSNWRWRTDPIDPGPVAVVDMDGVLSDASNRQHYLEGSRDWDGFFGACGEDNLLADNAALLDVIDSEFGIVLLTARPQWVQPETLGWLERQDLRWDLLIMRADGDWQSSAEFKTDEVGLLRTEGFEPRIAFDDDVRNVEAFRRLGLRAIYVHSGYYE